jgi:hypothetical protein
MPDSYTIKSSYSSNLTMEAEGSSKIYLPNYTAAYSPRSNLWSHTRSCCFSATEHTQNYVTLSRPHWPRCLRRGSAAARFLGLRVLISPRAWMFIFCECCALSCRVVSASGCSLVQRSTTECGVSECGREPSIMRGPWPIRGCCTMVKKTIFRYTAY